MRRVLILALVLGAVTPPAVVAGSALRAGERAIDVDGLYAAQVVLYDCPDGCDGPAGYYKLWRPDARGTLRRLDDLGPRGSFATPTPPTLSPDGRWVAYSVGRSRLVVQRVDLRRGRPSGERVVLPAILHDVHEDTGVPAWSPDSRELALVGQVRGDHGLWVVRRDGSGLHRVVCSCDLQVESEVDDGVWPAWSSRGRIAFTGTRRKDDLSALHVVNADGGGLTRVTRWRSSAMTREPAWSPDGRSLAFTVDETGSEPVMYVTGKGRVRRVRGAHAPVWAPDGRSLAYVRDDAQVLVAPASSPQSGRRLRSAPALRDLGWIVRLGWLG